MACRHAILNCDSPNQNLSGFFFARFCDEQLSEYVFHAVFVKKRSCCGANDVDGDKSTNLEQLEIITIADTRESLLEVIKSMQNSFDNSDITSSISTDHLTHVKGYGP